LRTSITSAPAPSLDESSNFYYRDDENYWKKIRALAFAHAHDPTFTENEALLITSHFNLGTTSGPASENVIDAEPYL
jgi:hypothetical protein